MKKRTSCRGPHGTRGVGARGRNVGRRPGRAGTPASCREPPTDGSEDVSTHLLRHRSVAELVKRRVDPLPAEAFTVAAPIVEAVRARGEAALREYAERFADVAVAGPLFIDRAALGRARESLPSEDRTRLERVAERIQTFADAQKRALGDVTVTVPGGTAGHWIAPLERAGCYAPGGRYPLPSSVLMTAVTAKTAGVSEVWVASPKPGPM
ncbi:MAG: hypothetical protein DMD64_02355, partial [Gemmatimonadetes bacterium]